MNTELEEELHQAQDVLKIQKQEAELLTANTTKLQTKNKDVMIV